MDVVIDQEKSCRFIVLITNCLANHRELAHTVHWMAERENLSILYLVLVDNNEDMLAASRSMATLKAMTSSNKLQVEVKLTETGLWRTALTEIAGPGDVVVCQDEEVFFEHSNKAVSISDFLTSRMNLPVYTIPSYSRSNQPHKKKWFQEILILLGFLVIGAGFTWLQFQLDIATGGSLQKILMIGSFSLELAAIWAWYLVSNR